MAAPALASSRTGARRPTQQPIPDTDLIFPNDWRESERRRAVYKLPDSGWNQQRPIYRYGAAYLFACLCFLFLMSALLGKDRF